MGKYHDGIKEIPFPMCLAFFQVGAWTMMMRGVENFPHNLTYGPDLLRKEDATGRVILLLSDFSEDEVEKRFLFDKNSS